MPSDPLRRSQFRFPDSFSMARFLRDLHCQEPEHLAETARGSISTLVVTVMRKASDESERVERLAAEWHGTTIPETA